MKKILLIMICMILLVGTISALLPVKQYDLETQTVTIVNTLGLGRDIATAQLNTPLDYNVSVGYNKIAEFTVNLFDDSYLDAIGLTKLYNLNDNEKEFQRQLDYKYKVVKQVEVEDYDDVCSKPYVCEKVLTGTHFEDRIEWFDLDTSVLLKGEITIGIFTEVKKGDYVEWIPNLFGKKIGEWATWTASMNVDLISYWKLDETTGAVIDEQGANNGTNNGATRGATGIILNAFDFVTGESDYVDVGQNTMDLTDGNMSINMWIKPDDHTHQYQLFSGNATNGWTSLLTTGALIGFGKVGVAEVYSNDLVLDGEWSMITIVYDGTANQVQFFINGTADSGGLDAFSSTFAADIDYWIGGHGVSEYYFNGVMDEIGLWNRSLSNSEITDLYNSGSGLPFFSPPTITLNSPVDTYNTTNITITFNSTIDSLSLDLINVSFILNGSYISTNSSGFNNSNYINTYIFPELGLYNWTYESCNNESLCSNATERTLTLSSAIEEGIFYQSTFETAEETFIINITTNGSQTTSAEFFYNDVSQGASTKTGTDSSVNFSNIIQIPTGKGNKEFYWNVTIGSSVFKTTVTNQSIDSTLFLACNATYTTSFLNLTFKNETQNAFINASIPTSNFVYGLGDGTYTKTLTYVNATNNYWYPFCAYPSNKTFKIDPYIQYKQGSDYPQRVYDIDETNYTNSTTNLTLYLLQVSNGIYVTFQTINIGNVVVSGVEVTAKREISGTDVIVGQGTTSSDGAVTFWLNPDFIHDFTFEKSGFTTYNTSFAPTQTSYTITMGGNVATSNSYIRGIDYSILPTNSSLANDTIYTFGFNLTSSFWSLEDYGFDLRLVNGTVITGDSSTTSGTQLTLNYNVTNQTKIYLDYYWLINSTFTNGTSEWVVYSTSYSQWSINTFFTDLKLYLDSGMFGIDDFGRYLIIFIIIFFTIGIMSYKYGFVSPMVITTTTFLILFFFDFVVGIIPPITIPSGREVPNLLTLLSGLILTMVIFKEATT